MQAAQWLFEMDWSRIPARIRYLLRLKRPMKQERSYRKLLEFNVLTTESAGTLWQRMKQEHMKQFDLHPVRVFPINCWENMEEMLDGIASKKYLYEQEVCQLYQFLN